MSAVEPAATAQEMQVWLALAAAIMGGAGLKAIEVLLHKGKERSDLAQQMREELRKEIAELKQEVTKVDSDLDRWKQKYFDLLEQMLRDEIQVHPEMD